MPAAPDARPAPPSGIAYGLRVPSASFAPDRLLPAPADASAEPWALELHDGFVAPPPAERLPEAHGERRPIAMDAHGATIDYGDARLHLTRAARTAELTHAGAVHPERLVHPLLAAVGICAAHWRGDIPLHAGAVILGGQAWVLLAGRADGKSTTLAALADAGHPVLTDDLLVVDQECAGQIGPRCVDLRAGGLAAGRDDLTHVPTIGTRSRLRLGLGPAPAAAPIGGFVLLGWGDELRTATVPVQNRGAALGAALAIDARSAAPRVLLELTTRPMVALERPQSLDTLPATIAALEALAS